MVSPKSWISNLKSPIVGILSFEFAKSMARIVSLHESLTDTEISKLRTDTIRSPGIQYLTSKDESFLLELARREFLEDLERVASNVSRLGAKCKSPSLRSLDRVFSDLVQARLDLTGLGLLFNEKEITKKIKKMEKLINATSSLYSALEMLKELEISDRKLQQWKSYNGPFQRINKPNSDLFQQKLSSQKQYVKKLRASSLWDRPIDEIVELMARFVCTIYVRICLVFAPAHLFSLHFANPSPMQKLPTHFSGPLGQKPIPGRSVITRSGPISPQGISNLSNLTSESKEISELQSLSKLRNSEFNVRIGQERSSCDLGLISKQRQLPQGCSRVLFSKNSDKNNGITHAPSSTVGGSGFALLYSNLVVIVERFLGFPNSVDDNARDNLYQMLPTKLRMSIRGKLKDYVKDSNSNFFTCDALLAKDWKDAMERILGWLAPLAHAMIRWQSQRNLEKQSFDSRTNVLLLQTLYYSDREKTEAAIVELLVALSFICHYRLMNPKGRV